MTLEELRAKAKETMEAKIQNIKEQAEIRQLNQIINGPLGEALAKRSLSEEALATLKDIETLASDIVKSNPILNKTTRQIREFNPSRVFGYGMHISVLIGVLSGIQYSATQHKMLILAAYPALTESLIADTLEAFGQPAYFSNNYGVIVEEKPFDYAKARELVEIIGNQLGIQLDLSQFSEAAMANEFDKARTRAETAKAEYELGAIIKEVPAEDVGTIQVEG